MSQYFCVPSCRLVWDRRKKAAGKADGRCPVELEVIFRRKRKWVSSRVMLSAKEWDPVRCRVIKRGDLVELNERLSVMVSRMECLFAELQRTGREFEFWMMDEALEGGRVQEIVECDEVDRWKDVDLLEWIEERISQRKDLREGTLATHKSMVECVRRYNDWCVKTSGFREKRIERFGDLRKVNIVGFDRWLHDENGYEQSTIYGYHKRLKRYVNEAKLLEMVRNNPYDVVKIDRGRKNDIRYLTDAEIGLLRQVDLGGRVLLEKVRDMFLFQCWTGLAYADMARFSMERCEVRGGRLWLRDERVKSAETYWVLVMQPARDILEKWGGRLPVMSNQKYNEYLKIVAERCGLSINLTTHVARHTFGVMAINNGVQVEVLAKMMGHTQIQTTQLYAKVLGKSVEEAFVGLEKLIN